LAGSEIVICGEEFRLALACSSAPVIINGKPVANPYGVQPEVARKNAVLMASAPLLLAALDRLQANPNDPRCHGEAIAAMKAARGQI
jgi:hypothetical protein